MHAELSRLVRRRADDATLARPADDHRLTTDLRPVALFDRRVECVHIDMNDFAHLQTPAFLVDRNIVEQNCARMREKARESGVAFRPHVKTHKTIEIARMQHGGALGPITVSTIAEAEFFADAGFKDITYAVPIAPEKIDRAAALARKIETLNLLLDSDSALQALEARKQRFDVFLKVDCGYHRAGVDPDSDAGVQLAKAIAGSPSVRFNGLLTHAGHSYDAKNVEEIRRAAKEE